MTLKHTTYFFPAKKKGREYGLLMMRVSWNGNIVHFSLGRQISTDMWDYGEQRCRNRSFHGSRRTPALTINNEIGRHAAIVEDVMSDFARKGKVPSIFEVKAAVQSATSGDGAGNAGRVTVDSLFGRFIDTEGRTNGWSEGTVKKMRTVRKHLNEYAPGLTLDALSADTLRGFTDWNISEGYSNNTIQKHLSVMRWFIRWMARNGYGNTADAERFRSGVRTYDREVIYLTWDELMRVYNLDLTDTVEQQARDGFCLSCFTGLRYSDLANLKRRDVSWDTIRIVTKKTADCLYIDLNRWSRSILDRYSDWQAPDGSALPVLWNQVMNRALKRIGMKAGLDSEVTMVTYTGGRRVERTYRKWQLLTTHCGRRTFVVNAMTLGVPDSVIMSWTGHHSIAAMKPYRKVVDSLKRSMMDRFDALPDK